MHTKLCNFRPKCKCHLQEILVFPCVVVPRNFYYELTLTHVMHPSTNLMKRPTSMPMEEVLPLFQAPNYFIMKTFLPQGRKKSHHNFINFNNNSIIKGTKSSIFTLQRLTIIENSILQEVKLLVIILSNSLLTKKSNSFLVTILSNSLLTLLCD